MKKQNHGTARQLLAIAIALGLAYVPAWSPSAGAQTTGDDIFLLTASAAPNVILLMDNSLSMQHIEWHPAFDPQKVPDASYCTSSAAFGGALDPDAEYAVSGNTNASCSFPGRAARTVYGPAWRCRSRC